MGIQNVALEGVVLKLHAKLAPDREWVLIRVNFDPHTILPFLLKP